MSLTDQNTSIIYSPELKHNIAFLSHIERLFIYISNNAFNLITLKLKGDQTSTAISASEIYSCFNSQGNVVSPLLIRMA